MSQLTLEEQLQQLLDRQACEDVLLRYGRTLDWLDADGQAECFWPDAEVDYGFYSGDAEGWLPTVMEVEAGSAVRWHLSGSILVTVSGDTARAESYGLTMAAPPGEGERTATLFGGRYLDELEKRDGQWRISRRRYVADWAQQFPDNLADISAAGFSLNSLDISSPGHPDYRAL